MKKEIILLTPFALCVVIAIIIIALYDYRIKKRILELGPIDDNALQFLMSMSGLGASVLKWGLILFFGGIGLVIIEFIPEEINQSTLAFGIEAIFIALGFLVYYFIMKKEQR